MLGGSRGPTMVRLDGGGAWNVAKMLQAAEDWAINFGCLARGNSSKPRSPADRIAGGGIGHKTQEDWGGMPAALRRGGGIPREWRQVLRRSGVPGVTRTRDLRFRKP
jgi:urease alpha subunit